MARAWAVEGEKRGPGRDTQWHFVIIWNNPNEFELIWLKDELPVLEIF
jgi:hypothetical protein